MTIELAKLKALTIRQPWADLILRGLKTIEIREWQVKHRGPFLIHVSRTIDWKTVQLLCYEGVEELPRGMIVGYAQIEDVVLLNHDRRLAHLKDHWVVHPLPEFSCAAVLSNMKPFSKPIRCSGRPFFFSPPPNILRTCGRRLEELGFDVQENSIT